MDAWIRFRRKVMAKRFQIILCVVVAYGLFSTVPVHAVTRDELINKCIEAGNIVKNQGLAAAIKTIEDTKGPFVWHNNVNYLFLMNLNCKMLAHPFSPGLKKYDTLVDYADVKGALFFAEFVKVAKTKVGMGWVKYMWPLPGKTEPIQKYTFIYRIPDTDYFIGSGLYVIKPGQYY
jgi:cytochrome c